MASFSTCIFLISLIKIWDLLRVDAKVFMVLLEEEPVISLKANQTHTSDEDAMMYKERLRAGHDDLLESLLQKGSYTKLYSYTHLLNGFAIHSASEEVLSSLQNVTGIRAIHEDMKMEKFTTYTPEFLGIPSGVWRNLGGSEMAGEGVVIGFIDTGINPVHPSFSSHSSRGILKGHKFKGTCAIGEKFPSTACNGKIEGAQYFASAAIAAGDFNSTRDYASPFDADGHGRQAAHTASIAAGNHQIPVITNDFNYGYASGMAPGARIAVYKALYTFGGYMSDVVAAVDQAVEDGVDILSLSIGPSTVPSGPSFLDVLEMALLFATKAGVLVVQSAGNRGPSSSSILSFSPWITSVAASVTDRHYINIIRLNNGQRFYGIGLSPPTAGEMSFPIAAAADVCHMNTTTGTLTVESCQHPDLFIPSLVRRKIILCTYNFDFEYETASIATVADTVMKIGAVGFILAMDPDLGAEQVKRITMTLPVPGIVLNNMQASSALWGYYNSNTIRSRSGRVVVFGAKARLLDGRKAIYSGRAPVVASYSSRGPDVNNALLQTADVLKPNVMAPGSSIWAAWSPSSEGDPYIKGQNFALVSGTSMATPHIAGVAALIKQKHPKWSPAAITSAMMTSADVFDNSGSPILAQSTNQLLPATPFDFGAGSINATRAIDPGLIFDAQFEHYVQFLCAVPSIDGKAVRRATGIGCPTMKRAWCSDLNAPSITISNLVESRIVIRQVTNVSKMNETYTVSVREPLGVEITVSPKVLRIAGNASRHLWILLTATKATRAYTFGEMVLHGSRNHIVRVPIAVYVSTFSKVLTVV
ncbi:Peptidase_S8 domain-containing protein/Inhibitor_I9 domain-containing protein [Cephalotus follicularis]|uniref:Peptidase_S8 domain-containing protein/Inhibitor_I9 domain-containing protein n=2 Tax=Cephalotus follicularis TaxID=3775 RepID=A0A1Q3DIA9_CEPFO|nr:Peptidase_S8 domain-containing protein/Inhibitor_I9 domain-containing protein [Cephalotus follicularis]